jgi:hypothetical protein
MVDRLSERVTPAHRASGPLPEAMPDEGHRDDGHEPPDDEEAAHGPSLRARDDKARIPSVVESRDTGPADDAGAIVGGDDRAGHAGRPGCSEPERGVAPAETGVPCARWELRPVAIVVDIGGHLLWVVDLRVMRVDREGAS